MSLIESLRDTRDRTVPLFGLGDVELGKTYAEGKWSVRTILHHLADAETVLFDRIRRILSEGRPVIWAFDQDAWADALAYRSRPLALSRELYTATREGHIYYAERHYAADGQLEFVHSETGVRTLGDEMEKVAEHNAHHLDQIERALRMA